MMDSNASLMQSGKPSEIVSAKTTSQSSLPRRFWGSLDEYFETEEFWKWAQREFPEGASGFCDPVGHREFLRVMGAALAMAGLGACSPSPQIKIVPYVEQPEVLASTRELGTRFRNAMASSSE
jgi:MoCo/4Fe-4S cofactor protein with predicted Tat translocation signal